MSNQPLLLPIKTISQAAEEAKAEIERERSGEITGLYTRWPSVNRTLMKYWRFRSVTMLCGASGSGKSAILNMIEDDFTNINLNPTFLLAKDSNGNFTNVMKPKIAVLAFKYEMDASDEVLRNISGKVKKSYSYLLSAEPKLSDNILRDSEYNKISDEEFNQYSRELDKLKNKPIYFIEIAGNLEQLWATCSAYVEKHPGIKLIVTLDHTLLSQKLSEKDDLELTAKTAHVAIRLKKAFGAMVIFLAQLNGEIEKSIRRTDQKLHFPVKTDIHCGNQIYWACDNVAIFHRPELLGIEAYGNLNTIGAVSTKGIIHCAWIKSRKNKPNNIWFKNQFNIGNMEQIDPKSIKYKVDLTAGFG